jgi:ATP-binding cassette subfamily F protein 3
VKKNLIVSHLPQALSTSDSALTVNEFVQKNGWVDLSDYQLWYEAGRHFPDDPDLLYSDRLMRTLSGGERLRVELCRLCLERPDVLLLDEPSNDLDLSMLECSSVFF